MDAQAPPEHLTHAARQQLDTLRRAVDDRLSKLEAALSGSREGASLETLMLDLARVASDEAMAATELAYAEAKRETDGAKREADSAKREADSAKRDADAARRETDAALQRLTALEGRDAERRQLEQRYEAALASERARIADLDRAVQDARRQIDSHLTASVQSNDARARAEERAAALSRENADYAAKCEQLASEMARVRASAEEHERAHRELQQRVDAWQAEKDETKQVLESVKGVFMQFGQQKIAIDKRFRTLEGELERARAALAGRGAPTRP